MYSATAFACSGLQHFCMPPDKNIPSRLVFFLPLCHGENFDRAFSFKHFMLYSGLSYDAFIVLTSLEEQISPTLQGLKKGGIKEATLGFGR
jgi:hypothetical protein